MRDEYENWYDLIDDELKTNGESWDDVIHHTMTDEELHHKFYSGFGSEEGIPFTLWTETRVYFPICYDGAEWVGSTYRNPCDKSTIHQGGG